MSAAEEFAARVDHSLADSGLRDSLDALERSRTLMYRLAFDELDEPEALKQGATDVRKRSLAHLRNYLEQFEANVLSLGGEVHWAADSAEANEIIGRICAEAGARRVTKSKSMVTEEIGLLAELEQRGLDVVETDLGEYIIQLRGEPPSHITAPALHLSLQQVIDAFNESHDVERAEKLTTSDQLLAEARAVLREKFLNADVGITGANFLIAETGGVVVVTNEGNADLTASLPDTHIVVTGIEKVVPTLDDVGVLLQVLPRAAVGQRMTNYTSFFHGPKRGPDGDGPENFHVVLLDNGRADMLQTEFADMLRCIRCAACLNHCPVYAAIGGHAYGSIYPGPMGAVLTPQLTQLEGSSDLPNASTFCGRCEEVCPVGIPLPRLLRNWREQEFSRHLRARGERYGLRAWSWVARYAWLYRLTQSLLRRSLRVLPRGKSGWLRKVPGPGQGWTQYRDFPPPAAAGFQRQWAGRSEGGRRGEHA